MRPPTIWFDATTMWHLRQHAPVGLSRVEAHVLAGALTLPRERVGFGIYDRYAEAMRPMTRPDVESLLRNFGRSGGSGHGAAARTRHWTRRILREVERRLRVGGRGLAGRARRSLGTSATIRFRPGDLFVVSGATWGQWEPAVLEALLDREGVRLVVLLADMIPWKYPHHFQDAATRSGFLHFADLAARRAALVLCISRATRDDFLEFAGTTPAGPVEVIHLGDDAAAGAGHRPAGLPADAADRGHVLAVGTIQVRKNHHLLYQLWRRFAEEGRAVPRLVLAGAPGWLTDDLMAQVRTDPLSRDSITVLDRVDDAELVWLYRHALFTVYPSLYEGWGLPIVESFRHGTPCLASNTSSMPEAGQGLATHLDPLDFVAWHRAILARLDDPALLAVERERIRTGFRPRTWQAFSHEFADRVQRLADGLPATRHGDRETPLARSA